MKKKDSIETINLNDLPGDHLVSHMDYKQMEQLCEALREEIIQKTSVYGGHLSSNLGAVETVVALHHCFDFSKDKLIFDVGHQCYAHKILSGRSLEHLRHKGGVAGFQKRNESIYDPYEAGHSSTSISAATAFALARDQKKENYDVIAFIGDGSIVNGLSFEALNNLPSLESKVIIILNDNDMSISRPAGGIGKFFSRISTGSLYNKIKKGYRKALTRTRFGMKFYSFSRAIKDGIKRKLIPITMFDNMGFTYIGTIDGHNIKALVKAINRAKRSDKSVVIHVNTVKGKGYPFAEKDRMGSYHDVAPFDIATGKALKQSSSPSWSHFYAGLVKNRLENDPNSYLVVASTQTGSKLNDALSSFPSRSIDMGIAEEHAMTFAGALALNGFHPIISLYSTFLQRTYDNIQHDCARMNTPLTILVDRAGLVGENGETHQGIYDVAMLASIPNVVIAMPSSEELAKEVFNASFSYLGVTAIRYPKDDASSRGEVKNFTPYRFRVENHESSHDIGILTVGPKYHVFKESLKNHPAYNRMDFIDPVYLFPLQEENIKSMLDYSYLLVYDVYSTENGFASALLTALYKHGYQGKVLVKAVPNRFLYQATVSELEIDLGLSVDQVKDALDQFIAQ